MPQPERRRYSLRSPARRWADLEVDERLQAMGALADFEPFLVLLDAAQVEAAAGLQKWRNVNNSPTHDAYLKGAADGWEGIRNMMQHLLVELEDDVAEREKKATQAPRRKKYV